MKNTIFRIFTVDILIAVTELLIFCLFVSHCAYFVTPSHWEFFV